AAGAADDRRRARRVGISHRDPLVTTLTERPPVARRTNGHRMPPPPPTGGGDGPEREPGPRRPRLDNIRIAMLFLICGEIMFFGGLISAFLGLRVSAAVWLSRVAGAIVFCVALFWAFWVRGVSSALWRPPLQPRLPVGVTGVNTL